MRQDNPQQADVAYAAGFFDGEGSIAIYRGSGMNRDGIVFAVSCYQNDQRPLMWLKDTFGGGVYNRKCSEWRITGYGAAKFLELVVPYLRVKREKAEEALEMWRTRAAAETEWGGTSFTMRGDATVRSAGATQPAEAGGNDLSPERG